MQHTSEDQLAAPQQPAAHREERPGSGGLSTQLALSPRQAAQRRQLEDVMAKPVQRVEGQEEEDEDGAAQLRGDPAQRQENRTGMPDGLKAGIEALSGLDMSDVRVHRNSSQPAQLNALAYAQGNDIHLGPGQEQHLPHEAWHVVQQQQGRVQATMQMAGVGVNDEVSLEIEADVMGQEALQMQAGREQVPRISRTPIASNRPVQRSLEGKTGGPDVENLEQRLIYDRMMKKSESSARYRTFRSMIASEKDYTIEQIIEALKKTKADEVADDQRSSEHADDGEDSSEIDDGSRLEDEEEDQSGYDDVLSEDYAESVDYAEFEHDADFEDDAETTFNESIIEKFREAFIKCETVATIIWTGGNLGAHFFEPLKRTLQSIKNADELPTEDLAKQLLTLTTPNLKSDTVEQWNLVVRASDIQQQLDQEKEFAANVKMVYERLKSLQPLTVKVYRPADDDLLLPGPPESYWTPFNNAEKAAFEDNDKHKKHILVTMGHGASTGHTSFQNHGLLDQENIAKILNIPDNIATALLYIPLQCYPAQAVQKGKELKWHSGSVESKETIISSDIRQWIKDNMHKLIDQWVQNVHFAPK